jgi:hypothetical protein
MSGSYLTLRTNVRRLLNIYFGVELFSGGALNTQQKTRRRETGGLQLQRSRRGA